MAGDTLGGRVSGVDDPDEGLLVASAVGAERVRSNVPVGKVRFYDAEKGFGFLTKDEGGDVYVRSKALRKAPDQMTVIVEDLIKMLDGVGNSYRRGRYPDSRTGSKIASVLRAVADELEL